MTAKHNDKEKLFELFIFHRTQLTFRAGYKIPDKDHVQYVHRRFLNCSGVFFLSMSNRRKLNPYYKARCVRMVDVWMINIRLLYPHMPDGI